MPLRPRLAAVLAVRDGLDVVELLQDDATPEALGRETLLQLSDHGNATFLREHFTQMHLTLKQNMAEIGAKVVVDLLRSRSKL